MLSVCAMFGQPVPAVSVTDLRLSGGTPTWSEIR